MFRQDRRHAVTSHSAAVALQTNATPILGGVPIRNSQYADTSSRTFLIPPQYVIRVNEVFCVQDLLVQYVGASTAGLKRAPDCSQNMQPVDLVNEVLFEGVIHSRSPWKILVISLQMARYDALIVAPNRDEISSSPQIFAFQFPDSVLLGN